MTVSPALPPILWLQPLVWRGTAVAQGILFADVL